MESSETIRAQVSEKLEELTRKYDWIINAEVHFKPENDPEGTIRFVK